MKKHGLVLMVLMLLFLMIASFADAASTTVYKKTALTGGGGTALDGIDGAGLAASDMAFTTVSSVVYIHILDASNNSAESSPAIIAPDTNPGVKRWILQNAINSSQDVSPNTIWGSGYTGTGTIVRSGTPTLTTPNIGAATGTSVAVTGDVSGATVRGVLPNQIIGDGTAGRVLRVMYWNISDGTTADTIKVIKGQVWNSPNNHTTDNIAKNATTGGWTLHANGHILTLSDASSNGTNVSTLAVGKYGNTSTVDFNISYASAGGGGLALTFTNPTTDAAIDLTGVVGVAKEFTILITYLTAN